MGSLTGMKLRDRLLLVVVLPLLGLLFFSANTVLERSRAAEVMGNIEALVDLSVVYAALAHELQIERGMTGGFIASKGQRFATELPRQRGVADQRLQQVEATLKRFDTSAYPAVLDASLVRARQQLGALVATRDAISTLQMAGPEAIGYYTTTIDSLLTIGRQAMLLSDQQTVTRLATAYSNFSYGKEHTGIERALLNVVFTAGRFETAMVARVLNNASAQAVYLREFEFAASPAQRELYQGRLASDAVRAADQMKQTALAGIDGRQLGVDAAEWFEKITAKIDRLKEVEDRLAADFIDEAGRLRGEAERTFYLFVGLTLLLLVITLALIVAVIRSILRQIGGEPATAVEVANRIADGDLTVEVAVASGDTSSLLAAMQRMGVKLSQIVGQVRISSDSVGTSAREIAVGNDDLSQRTQEQASALEETASSMEEMTSAVRQNADNARQANQLAMGTRTQAEQGGQVVSQAIAAMSEINASSRRIVDIISVIDEIAFQTNLLALNAAVEAARAGEQGRGFAVVASEVRSLAQRSAGAAKEIKGLIEDSVEKIRSGSELVNTSGETLGEIVESVKKVTDIVAEIAAASQQQSSGIDEVNKAITQMDEVTQQNAALVEEAAAASRSMEEQAGRLVEMMQFFRVDENAARADW